MPVEGIAALEDAFNNCIESLLKYCSLRQRRLEQRNHETLVAVQCRTCCQVQVTLFVYFYVEKESISSENLCLRGHKNADQRLLMIILLKDIKHQLKRSRKIRDSIGFASAQHLESLPAPLACGFTVRKSQLLNAFVLCSRVAAIRHVAGHSVCCILLPSDAVLLERPGFFS